MTKGIYNYIADEGCVFVCTEFGYEHTPDAVKPERAVGKPIPLFHRQVPASWIEKGYVEERRWTGEKPPDNNPTKD